MENGEATTAATSAARIGLVFRDDAGSYFLLPQEVLEQARVPEEQKADVERLLAGRDDVQAFILPFIAGMIVGQGLVLVGYAIGRAMEGDGEGTITNAQYVEQVTGRPFGR